MLMYKTNFLEKYNISSHISFCVQVAPSLKLNCVRSIDFLFYQVVATRIM